MTKEKEAWLFLTKLLSRASCPKKLPPPSPPTTLQLPFGPHPQKIVKKTVYGPLKNFGESGFLIWKENNGRKRKKRQARGLENQAGEKQNGVTA